VNAKGKWGWTPLHTAAWEGHADVVAALIANGADVNAKDNDGKTPLHWAMNADVVEALIAHGADVNAKDNEGSTPLHGATDHGDADIVETLIAHGADVNAKDNKGRTPSCLAFSAWKKEAFRVLRKHGGRL
jgi:hypothetical protein